MMFEMFMEDTTGIDKPIPRGSEYPVYSPEDLAKIHSNIIEFLQRWNASRDPIIRAYAHSFAIKRYQHIIDCLREAQEEHIRESYDEFNCVLAHRTQLLKERRANK